MLHTDPNYLHWRILSKLNSIISCPYIMFLNKTKDSGDTYTAEIRTNFVLVETEVNSEASEYYQT